MTRSDYLLLSALTLALTTVCLGIITGVQALVYGPLGAWVLG